MSDAETIDEMPIGDLQDEGGAPLTDLQAEYALIGLMIREPGLVSEVRDLLSPREFYDRAMGRVYEGLIAADGFAPEKDKIVEWIGGPTMTIVGRSGGQLVGYLISLGMDLGPDDASRLADRIFEVGERRFTEDGQTNLVGLDAWQSKMGMLAFADRSTTAFNEPDWIGEDLIPERELILIMGEKQTGKSFATSHIGFCIARGQSFFSQRVREARPVIWCCYEGGNGARGRMLAYANYFDVQAEMPFAALTDPFDLWTNEKNVDELIKEIEGVCRSLGAKSAPVVIIDTHNAATPGASEIDSEVVSKIRDRYKTIVRVLDATVIIVGHTNALGKHRGNELLANNVPTILTVSYKTRVENRQPVQVKDNDDRPVRSLTVKAQREGETGKAFDFVLIGVKTGIKDSFGKDKTSCAVTEPNFTQEPEKGEEKKADTKGGFKLTDIESLFFDVLWRSLNEQGIPAPAELKLPPSTRVVHRSIVSKAYRESSIPQDGSQPVSDNTVKSRWDRSASKLRKYEVIGFKEPYFWWTGKPVLGKPATQRQRSWLDDVEPPPHADPYDFPEE